MFILVLDELKLVMFAKRLKIEFDTKLWHKRVVHINLPKLCEMQFSNFRSFVGKKIDG